MTETPPALRLSGLSKSFGEIHAVAGIDLEIPEGAIFGLLGPDGAGKSTLIRLLATVLAPDGGTAEVLGHPVSHPAAITGRIGYMPQKFSMYPDLSVAENLEFFARVRGVPGARRRERAAELLESMGIAPFTKRQANHLSGGMKQKLMLAGTLMHDPELLLLDEPTTGVDPVSRREFWTLLAGIHAEGRTVLVATPYMDEAERCTHIAFMDSGRITHFGTPDQLKDAVPGTLLEVHAADPRAVIRVLAGAAGIASTHLLGDVVRVLTTAAAETEALDSSIGASLAEAGIQASIRGVEMDMESVFTYLASEREAA